MQKPVLGEGAKEEMTTKLTGEQLREKFFIWKGWKQAYGKSWWLDTNGQQYAELPLIHTSLDLQEKWLWPELLKNDIRHCEFIYWVESGTLLCDLGRGQGFGRRSTKALAQLEAGLKALGVEV